MNARTSFTDTSARARIGSAAAMDNLDDDGVMAIVAELIADCEPLPFAAGDWDKREETAVETAAAAAYAATKRWMQLHERQAANPREDLTTEMHGARRAMREAHAVHTDWIEIEGIGDIGGGRTLRPGYYGQGIAVWEDGYDDPLMFLPRGLGQEAILLVLGTHDAAYAMGVVAGGNQVRDALSDLLRRR